jgi:hypothetical protein
VGWNLDEAWCSLSVAASERDALSAYWAPSASYGTASIRGEWEEVGVGGVSAEESKRTP